MAAVDLEGMPVMLELYPELAHEGLHASPEAGGLEGMTVAQAVDYVMEHHILENFGDAATRFDLNRILSEKGGKEANAKLRYSAMPKAEGRLPPHEALTYGQASQTLVNDERFLGKTEDAGGKPVWECAVRVYSAWDATGG